MTSSWHTLPSRASYECAFSKFFGEKWMRDIRSAFYYIAAGITVDENANMGLQNAKDSRRSTRIHRQSHPDNYLKYVHMGQSLFYTTNRESALKYTSINLLHTRMRSQIQKMLKSVFWGLK